MSPNRRGSRYSSSVESENSDNDVRMFVSGFRPGMIQNSSAHPQMDQPESTSAPVPPRDIFPRRRIFRDVLHPEACPQNHPPAVCAAQILKADMRNALPDNSLAESARYGFDFRHFGHFYQSGGRTSINEETEKTAFPSPGSPYPAGGGSWYFARVSRYARSSRTWYSSGAPG